MKIVALVGSIRKDSINKKIAYFVQNRYQEQVEIEVLTLESIPMYNQDTETNPASSVTELKEKIKACDGVLFVTPEYNHSMPGVLKNTLDWISRVDKVMQNKPVMIMGASPGVLGTVRSQAHLRQSLNSPNLSAFVLPGHEVIIGSVREKINDEGELTDTKTIEVIDKTVEAFQKWIHTTKNS